MIITPAPRFLHILGMNRGEQKIGGVIAPTMQASAIGVVMANKSDKLPDIKPGDVVYFRMENANPIVIDEQGVNVILFEDAILGSTPKNMIEKEFPGGLMKAAGRAIDPNSPGIMTPSGLRLPGNN